MTIRFIFAWYDFWIGGFIDRPNRRVYIFPVPMFGIIIQLKLPRRCAVCNRVMPKKREEGYCCYTTGVDE